MYGGKALKKIGIIICVVFYLLVSTLVFIRNNICFKILSCKRFLKKEFCFVYVEDVIEQSLNYQDNDNISACTSRDDISYEIYYDNKSGIPELRLESIKGKCYTVKTFVELLCNIVQEYGNIKILVNMCGTSLVKRFDIVGKPIVYLSNSYHDGSCY